MKSFIKKIIHRIYLLGLNEETRARDDFRTGHLHNRSAIGKNVILGPNARILNHQQDKTKVKIGESSIIMGDLLTFQHGGEISIGDFCFLGEQSRIWSAKEIIIGNRVLISHNVNIHDNNSHSMDPQLRHQEFAYLHANHLPMPNENLPASPVIIEDDVWIGFNSTVLKGVRIGRGAIIGACSVITEDVPPYAVIVGNPQRIVKFTD